MIDLNCLNSKKAVPVLLVLLGIALLDLASAFGWPLPVLVALHLTPVTDDTARGLAAGLGGTIAVLAAFQLLRIWARRALSRPGARLG
jgi:predicted membrane-bound dolichyl-phosphate-mannose-protein mannosyltransferase